MRRTRAIGPINAAKTWLPSYGTGALGDLTIGSNTNWSALASSAQTMNYVNLTISNTFTLTLDGDGATTYKPHILRCTGVCTINGGINGDGKGHIGAATGSTTGEGPGGGRGAVYTLNGGGGGAGHAAAGTNGTTQNQWGYGGWPYDGLGDILRQSYGNYCAGSGGGAGGANGGGTPGINGHGGGGLVIVAQSVVIASTATISLDGTTADAAVGTAGGGGGGSGGLLVVIADSITLPASGNVITATAGSGSAGGGGGSAGGDGAVGRIYLCYLSSISGDTAARCDPDATAINLRPRMGLG